MRDVILRHKREYVMKLIEDLNKKLDEMEEKTEIYEQIVRLNQLKIKEASLREAFLYKEKN